ncbi:MAG TPA: TonB-dependent receptor, partial [Vicinamibacterales bacterium]|nr:TonB-dependent receptor [Vicinamibacterales bacterium]
GTYSAHAAAHAYTAGLTYGLQQFQGSRVHTAGLQPATDPSRGVGEVFASDTWTIAPVVTLQLGARYARYDYLPQAALTSPRAAIIVTPVEGTRITATAGQRMLAPGAEEFLASPEVGPWLPPERTFAPLSGDDFSVERSRFVDVGVEHDLGDAYVIGVRRFHERVGDQLTAIFGLASSGIESPGHYSVANAGDFSADGWAVRVTATPVARVRGTIDYSVARASWVSRGDLTAITIWAPEAIRADHEAVHDLTTSLETSIPETLTRVFVLYQVNDAVVRPSDAAHGMTDARFDVQVNQALPFMPLRNARWEALVGVRNLFRETAESGSPYDELLVLHPPTRFVGGVLVKF